MLQMRVLGSLSGRRLPNTFAPDSASVARAPSFSPVNSISLGALKLVDDFFVPRSSNLPDATVFGALGRALALATRFESQCRALHGLSSITSNPSLLASETDLAQFLTAFEKRNLNSHIAAIAKLLNAEIEPFRVLNNARLARNNITHEATLGFEHWHEWPEAFGSALSALRGWVRQVGEGLQLVSSLSAVLTHEPFLVSSVLRTFRQRTSSGCSRGLKTRAPNNALQRTRRQSLALLPPRR